MLEVLRLAAAYLRFQSEVPAFSGEVARRVVELLQVPPPPPPPVLPLGEPARE